jgi:hypothetical protein
MSTEQWLLWAFVVLVVAIISHGLWMGGVTRKIVTLIGEVVMHTNSMKDALVKVTGESEKAKGVLEGKQEVHGIKSIDIERAAQLVADRVGDLVISRLLQDDRFAAKQGEGLKS